MKQQLPPKDGNFTALAISAAIAFILFAIVTASLSCTTTHAPIILKTIALGDSCEGYMWQGRTVIVPVYYPDPIWFDKIEYKLVQGHYDTHQPIDQQ